MTNTDKYRQTLTTFWNFWAGTAGTGNGGTAGTTLSVPRNERGTAGTDSFRSVFGRNEKGCPRRSAPDLIKKQEDESASGTVGTPLFVSLRPHRSFVLALACTQLNKKKNRSKKLPPEGSSSLILTGTC